MFYFLSFLIFWNFPLEIYKKMRLESSSSGNINFLILELESPISWNIRNFFKVNFSIFSSMSLNLHQVAPHYTSRILDWVEARAGFWSSGVNAIILEGGGEERADNFFSFLLDGFGNTVYMWCFRMFWLVPDELLRIGSCLGLKIPWYKVTNMFFRASLFAMNNEHECWLGQGSTPLSCRFALWLDGHFLAAVVRHKDWDSGSAWEVMWYLSYAMGKCVGLLFLNCLNAEISGAMLSWQHFICQHVTRWQGTV